MDAMVSARVPIEVKKRGEQELKRIGSSASELINAAYSYLLQCGELPQAKAPEQESSPDAKVLSGESARAFRERWNRRAVLEARAYDGENFKQLLDQARGDYYARFA